MKTDAELNRLIAERVMGLDVAEKNEHDWQRNEDGTIDMFGMESGDYHNGPRCVRCDYSYCEHCEHDDGSLCQPYISEYCTAPAAWGSLFVWLAEHATVPPLLLEYDGLGAYSATVAQDGRVDSLPGRALVLAALAAYGVDIED